jgi:hypothetical protein
VIAQYKYTVYIIFSINTENIISNRSLVDKNFSYCPQKPHPTLSKGEGFKVLFKVSPFGGDLEGASHNDVFFTCRIDSPCHRFARHPSLRLRRKEGVCKAFISCRPENPGTLRGK